MSRCHGTLVVQTPHGCKKCTRTWALPPSTAPKSFNKDTACWSPGDERASCSLCFNLEEKVLLMAKTSLLGYPFVSLAICRNSNKKYTWMYVFHHWIVPSLLLMLLLFSCARQIKSCKWACGWSNQAPDSVMILLIEPFNVIATIHKP